MKKKKPTLVKYKFDKPLNKRQTHFIVEHIGKGALRNIFLLGEIDKNLNLHMHSCNFYAKTKEEERIMRDGIACFNETWKEVKRKLRLNKPISYV